MKIVNIIGGLGNQLFQYAFAIALQSKYPNEIVKICDKAFIGYHLHNGFELVSIFDVKLGLATREEIHKLTYPFYNYRSWQFFRHLMPRGKHTYLEKKSMVYQKDALTQEYNTFYDGYWQCEKYFYKFRAEILEAFRFPEIENPKTLNLLKSLDGKTSVSVHVRRGDYLNNKYFKGICDESYYHRAISEIKNKIKVDVFIVFSNDINWCKKNLETDFAGTNVVYVDWNIGKDSFRDIQLMSLCSHNIVANSSFSWWGAWLNQNSEKIVIAPKQWKNVDYNLDIIPISWLKI